MPKGGGAPPQGGTACPKGGGAWPKGGGAPGIVGGAWPGAPAPAGAAPPCVIQAGIVAPRPRPTGAAGIEGVSFLGDSERLLRDDRLRSRSLSLLLLRLRRRRERDGIALARAQLFVRGYLSAQLSAASKWAGKVVCAQLSLALEARSDSWRRGDV